MSKANYKFFTEHLFKTSYIPLKSKDDKVYSVTNGTIDVKGAWCKLFLNSLALVKKN